MQTYIGLNIWTKKLQNDQRLNNQVCKIRFDYKINRKTQKYSLSKCLLRHDVVRVFVSFLVLVFVRAFCHGALKHDISTLFTTFFVWTSL